MSETARELSAAIEESQLELYYQPIVLLADRSATMLEALPRWPHPTRGVLAPTEFIEVAIEAGLLPALERWAIGEACRQLSRWRGGVAAELTISLNLSGVHLYEGDVAGAVAEASGGQDVSPQRLGFEIPEVALATAPEGGIEKLHGLAGLGVTLVVDDYRSALSRDLIPELPITGIKVSRSLVAGIPDDGESLEAVRAIIELGHEHELTVIASGVESPGQLAALRELGCDCAQGFLFSVPMPAAVLEERMAPPR